MPFGGGPEIVCVRWALASSPRKHTQRTTHTVTPVRCGSEWAPALMSVIVVPGQWSDARFEPEAVRTRCGLRPTPL